MVATRPYIIYTLPKSRTTQALIGGKIEKVWASTELFLKNCTNANTDNPNSIYLVGYTAGKDHGEHPELADKIISRTKASFGEGVTKTIGYLYPSNTPLSQTKTEWKLMPKDLSRALEFIISGQPYPKYNLGPLDLIISYDFKLVDPESKIELPYQQFTSSVLLWLAKSNCVAPSLCFPFVEPNKEFWHYVDKIKKFIPFKLDTKCLRLGYANKKGTGNVFSKLL